jgi:transcriptional regulator with XRE-family HTH domain
MELHRRFGLNVKNARKAAGHSQEAFADLAGIARSYMSDIERGARNPTLAMVERIALALDVEPASLLLTAPVLTPTNGDAI